MASKGDTSLKMGKYILSNYLPSVMMGFSSAATKVLTDLRYLNVIFLYSNKSSQDLKGTDRTSWLTHLPWKLRGMSACLSASLEASAVAPARGRILDSLFHFSFPGNILCSSKDMIRKILH